MTKTRTICLIVLASVLCGLAVSRKPAPDLRDALAADPASSALDQLRSATGNQGGEAAPSVQGRALETTGTNLKALYEKIPLDDYELGIKNYQDFWKEAAARYGSAKILGGKDRGFGFTGGGVSNSQVEAAVATGLQGSELTCVRYASAACMTLIGNKTIKAQKMKEITVAPLIRKGVVDAKKEVRILQKGAVEIAHLRELVEKLSSPAPQGRIGRWKQAYASNRLDNKISRYKDEAVAIKRHLLMEANQHGMYIPELPQMLGFKVRRLDPDYAVFRTCHRINEQNNLNNSRSLPVPQPQMQEDIRACFASAKALRELMEKEIRQGQPVLTSIGISRPSDHAILVLGMDMNTGSLEDNIYYYDSNVGYSAVPLRRFYPWQAYMLEAPAQP